MPEVEHAVLRVLAKDRQKRPQTARELFEEFRSAVEAALPPGSPRSTPPTWDAVSSSAIEPPNCSVLFPTEADSPSTYPGPAAREALPHAPRARPWRVSSPLQKLVDWMRGTPVLTPGMGEVESSSTRAGHKGSTERPSPPALPDRPATIRRNTDVSFPARVQVGKLQGLRIQLVPAEETLSGGAIRELPKAHDHDTIVRLTVPLPPSPGEPTPPVRVGIALDVENFEIEGPDHAEIEVPLVGKSEVARFGLRGLKVGPGRIMIDFAQGGRPAGSVDLSPDVIEETLAPGGPTASALGPVGLSLSLGADAPPDLVLKVFEHRHAGQPGRLHFVLSSAHRALADLPVLDGDLGTQDLRAEVAPWVGEQLRALGALAEQPGRSVEEVSRALADVGFRLLSIPGI
jgi:hypothetical protein